MSVLFASRRAGRIDVSSALDKVITHMLLEPPPLPPLPEGNNANIPPYHYNDFDDAGQQTCMLILQRYPIPTVVGWRINRQSVVRIVYLAGTAIYVLTRFVPKK